MNERPPLKQKIGVQSGTIVEITSISKRVKKFRLQPENQFKWIAGQFIVTITDIDGKDKIADYTIISTTTEIDSIEILVDNYPGSKVGKLLHASKIGDKITFKGPRGRFFIENPRTDDDLVFICRNIGIAATIPLLQELFEQNNPTNIKIFNVLTDDFEPILEEVIEDFKDVLNIEYQVLNAKNTDIDMKKFNAGKFTKKEVEAIFGQYVDRFFYLSGASEFNKNLRLKLLSIGVEKNRLEREMFG